MSLNNTSSKEKNKNLDLLKTKHDIISFISKNIDIVDYEQIISKWSDVDTITPQKYIVCAREEGTKVWVVFYQSGECFYSVNFVRDYPKDLNKIKIYPVNITATKSIYSGTILECIHYKIENVHHYAIFEVYTLGGENQLLKSKSERLKIMNESLMKYVAKTSDCNIYICPHFAITKETLENDIFEKVKINPNIKEIVFSPKVYGNPVYTYKIIKNDLVDQVVKICTFKMCKLNHVDQYNLLNIRTGEVVEEAYIPDITTSKLCQQWFKTKQKEILVTCKLDHIKLKWIPFQRATD